MEGIRMQQGETNTTNKSGYSVVPDTKFLTDYQKKQELKELEEKEKQRPRIKMNNLCTFLAVLGCIGVAYGCYYYPIHVYKNFFLIKRPSSFGFIAVITAIVIAASLVLSVIDKIKKTDNKRALVNIIINAAAILISVIFFAVYQIGFIINPRRYYYKTTLNSNIHFYDKMIACLDEHDFDVAIHNDSIRKYNFDTDTYDILLYVSSDASPEKHEELTDYFNELIRISKYFNGYTDNRRVMTINVLWVYYCPDEKEGFYDGYQQTIGASDKFIPSDVEEINNYIALNLQKHEGKIDTEPDKLVDAIIVVK